MSWKDEYGTASFKKVQFNVDSHEAAYGKRIAKHEFINRDGHYPEEHGRKADTLKIEGFVLGVNYHEQRDALIKVCQESGEGVLVDPYFGELTVICESFEVRESSAEGGVARFLFSFIESGPVIYPETIESPEASLKENANDTLSKAKAEFIEKYSVSGLPSFVASEASIYVEAFADAIESSTAFLFGEVDHISDLAVSINNIRLNIDSIVNTPEALSNALEGSILLLGQAAGRTQTATKALLNIPLIDPPVDPGNATDTRSVSNKNKAAIKEYVNVVAASSAAFYAGNGDYESRDDAIEARDVITQVIDDLLEIILGNDEFVALTNVRTDLVKALPTHDERLPVIREFLPSLTLPSIVIAHNLYGDADRGEEIVQRNKIRHPGFVTGGRIIKVLSHG